MGAFYWVAVNLLDQVAKKLKEDPDDEPVIISTSTSLSNNSSSRGSSTDYKRAQNGRFAPTGVPYSRNQSNMASYARVAAKIPCTKCDKKFDSKTDLEKHDGKEHDENRSGNISNGISEERSPQMRGVRG